MPQVFQFFTEHPEPLQNKDSERIFSGFTEHGVSKITHNEAFFGEVFENRHFALVLAWVAEHSVTREGIPFTVLKQRSSARRQRRTRVTREGIPFTVLKR